MTVAVGVVVLAENSPAGDDGDDDDDGGGAYVTVTVIASWNRERVQQQQHDVLLTSFNTCRCKEFCSFIVSVNRCDSCMTEPLSNN